MAEIKYFTVVDTVEMFGYTIRIHYEHSPKGGNLFFGIWEPQQGVVIVQGLTPPFSGEEVFAHVYMRLRPLDPEERETARHYYALVSEVVSKVRVMSGQELLVTLPSFLIREQIHIQESKETNEPQV